MASMTLSTHLVPNALWLSYRKINLKDKEVQGAHIVRRQREDAREVEERVAESIRMI